MRKAIPLAFSLTLAFLLFACSTSRKPRNTVLETQAKAPKLVIGIVVDQMRYDYLERFWSNFGEGGFKRLVGEGTNFDQCNYNYIPTETAPGHASIFTGTTPSNHGIIMNSWLDDADIANGVVRAHSSVDDANFPLLGLPAPYVLGRGASPHYLDASTIADQLKLATNGQARTVGVSLKDRSAILPVGRSADVAFWFDDLTGNMVSSTYYPEMKAGFPQWLDSLNALRKPMNYLTEKNGWTLLLDPSAYVSADDENDIRYEGTFDSLDTPNFPHTFRVNPIMCCGEFKSTPFGNVFLKDFAKEVIKRYELGADDVTDFMSLSFSSTDMVAHQFGPQSREVEDTYIRLDRDLEDFLKFIDLTLGKGNVLIFLTADHGGAPNPVYANEHGQKGGWLNASELQSRIHAAIGDKPGQDSLLVKVQGHTIYLDRKLAAARNLNLDSLSMVVAKATEAFPGVEKAYTAKGISEIAEISGPASMLKNGFYPDRSGDVLFITSYGYMQAPYSPKQPFRYNKGTSHGSVYDYDTHVPLLFWGWNMNEKHLKEQVVIPDIAATVCSLLKIAPTNKASGKPILSGN